MTSQKTSSALARRIAVAAQNFGVKGRLTGRPTRARIVQAVKDLGVLQIDSVNVLARAHYLPLFARLGAYDQTLLDRAAWAEPRALFEYWAHMASFSPVENHRLFRWRMERALTGAGTWGRIARFAREQRKYLDRILAEIEARGPLAASELAGEKKKAAGWWEWSDAKHAVETLFWQGRLAVASRRAGFERVYDLPERVIPAPIWNAKTPDVETAHRELLAIAARALGIATEDDLADYFRLARSEARPRIAELVEAGTLAATTVEGWSRPAWIHRDFLRAKRSSHAAAVALLAPFDPLVWYRPRAHRLFGFHYRIGIYTPAHQRTHGYYVLPFLLGDDLVARVDLKVDRAAGVLRVQSAWLEASPRGIPRGDRQGRVAEEVASPLAEELCRMAEWLSRGDVAVARKGTLAPALRSILRG